MLTPPPEHSPGAIFVIKCKYYNLVTVQFSILHIMWINLGHIGRYAEQKHCDLWFAGVVSVACSKPNKHPIYTTFYTQIWGWVV